jgi:hypothetical protein
MFHCLNCLIHGQCSAHVVGREYTQVHISLLWRETGINIKANRFFWRIVRASSSEDSSTIPILLETLQAGQVANVFPDP